MLCKDAVRASTFELQVYTKYTKMSIFFINTQFIFNKDLILGCENNGFMGKTSS